MGMAYIPTQNVNTIKNWKYTKGYQVYATKQDTINFRGFTIKPSEYPLTINPLKWQIAPYYPTFATHPAYACASINSSLLMLKNSDGQIYSPAYGIYQIDSLRPGEGYKLISNTSASTYLRYPDTATTQLFLLYTALKGKLAEKKYSPISEKTGSSMLIVIESDSIKQGDEIAIKGANGTIYGATIAQSSKTSIVAWGAQCKLSRR